MVLNPFERANFREHHHHTGQLINNETGEPFEATVTENNVTNIINEVSVTEIVNQLTEVEENNTYITQITENNTFVTEVTNISNTTITSRKGVADDLATLASDSQLTHSQIPTELKSTALPIFIDGGAAAPTTGVKFIMRWPYAVVVSAWEITSDVSGSCVIDVWKDTYANYPPTVADTIAGSEKPTLSSAVKAQDTSLNSGSGWSFALGDYMVLNLDSASTLTKIHLSLIYTRTIT